MKKIAYFIYIISVYYYYIYYLYLYIKYYVIKITIYYLIDLNRQNVENVKITIKIIIYRYVSQWYIAPLHAQKLLLFIMQQSIKGTAMIVGGIFVPSLEGFATVIERV